MLSSDGSGSREEGNRISRIQTRWSILAAAHQGEMSDVACRARAELAGRYVGAIYRYLTKIMNNPAEAEDVAHDVILRLMEGRFAGADPSRGRFRDYLKTVIRNAVHDHRKKQSRSERVGLPDEQVIPSREMQSVISFEDGLRTDLLNRAWTALDAYESNSGKPYASLLRLRLQDPDGDSQQLALFLADKIQKTVSETGARKVLQRAREKLAELLIDELRTMLPHEDRSLSRLESELADLQLLDLCRRALKNS
jgi:RNA polymerase sigma factor (sigma-70 family)